MRPVVLHPCSLAAGVAFACAVLALPMSGQGDVEFFEDFEGGGAGWSMTTEPGCPFYTGPSLWHVTDAGECGSPTRMAAYNRFPAACNYFTGVGGCNLGVLLSPEFTIHSDALGLEFDYIKQMDSIYDGVLVYVVRGSEWRWFSALPDSATQQHVITGLPVNPYWSGLPIRLAFWAEAGYFEDEDSGAGLGMMIDNIRVVQRPRVFAVSPDHVPFDQSTVVSIEGLDLLGATAVRFGELSVPFIVESDSRISARVPPTYTTGYVQVSVARGPWSGWLNDAFDRFEPPVEIGRPCGDVRLDWEGAPSLGETCTVTTSGFGIEGQLILIDWSNIGTRTPHARRALDCSVGLVADQVVFMQFNPRYTFQIPGNIGMIGEHLRMQAVVLRSPAVATQIWDATIGE